MLHITVPAAFAVLLVGCAAAEPPPAAPAPEPVEEVVVEPTPAAEPQIPIEERIRAPFAVQSSGRPAPRERRTDPVVLDAAPATPTAAPIAPAAAPPSAAATANAPASPARAAANPPATRREHRVASGETFFGIARRYGVTPMALAAVNPGVDSQRLRAGEVLRLPADAAVATPPPPRGTPAAPARAERTHTVAAGETLWGIARRYEVTPDRIRAANRMSGDTVRIGETLVIPGAAGGR
ncbi:MAG: LysM peptidoglycan-binding domain-containing protein [Gemmatimonadetes bacterium]|nr:LysM peptidoglycan-binding domain-containing protein [Gemmatimonadota bacterium]